MSDADDLSIRPVDPSTWSDLERLFEQPGGPHFCWCMVWRPMPSRMRGDKSAKKVALLSRVAADVPIGILAYSATAPIGWCSIAPRPTYRKLTEVDRHEAAQDVWSIACLFVHRPYRGRGVAAALIDGAVSYARAGGATVVEAYPVDPEAPSYRFMGFRPQFEAAGFAYVGPAGSRRHVMRLSLA